MKKGCLRGFKCGTHLTLSIVYGLKCVSVSIILVKRQLIWVQSRVQAPKCILSRCSDITAACKELFQMTESSLSIWPSVCNKQSEVCCEDPSFYVINEHFKGVLCKIADCSVSFPGHQILMKLNISSVFDHTCTDFRAGFCLASHEDSMHQQCTWPLLILRPTCFMKTMNGLLILAITVTIQPMLCSHVEFGNFVTAAWNKAWISTILAVQLIYSTHSSVNHGEPHFSQPSWSTLQSTIVNHTSVNHGEQHFSQQSCSQP